MKFSLSIQASLICICVIFLSPLSSGQFCNGPKRGYINDTSGANHDDYITVGFLFPFHGSDADGTVCKSTIPDPQTIQLLEMARYTLWFGSISGVRIALEAFDSCSSGQVAVEQSVRYLNDRLQSASGGSQTCPDGSFKPGMIIHGAGSVGPSVASFLTDAQVPTVSYAATQSQLTNDDEFLYFSRTIPSDRSEAMAITDLLIRMGWTYVSVIHSTARDHVSSMESFKTAAARSNICISKTVSITADDTNFDIGNTLLSLIVSPGTPSVVVVFASTSQAQQLLLFASNNGQTINPRLEQIQWILGQHAISDTSYLDDLSVTTTRGILGVIPDDLVKAPGHSFLNYFKTQTPTSVNPCENPWFKEFWQEAYQCNLDGGTKYQIPCSSAQEAQHQANTKLYPHTEFVQNAINNFLTGLNTAQQAKCGSGTSGLCQEFKSMMPNELLGYIKGAAYKQNGDPSAVKFAIQNYKLGALSGFYTMETVGSWEEGSVGLTLNPSDVELWSNDNREGPVSSVCGSDCYDESCLLVANVTRVYRNGDIILGGMFSIHRPNEDQCGEINDDGIQRLEAMLFALDKLNQDNSILPGITVGIDGFDTCGIPTKAGHLALQFSASADFGKSGSGERRGQNGLSEHIYAVIGPETDDESEIVSQITNVYELPIMGFSADSGALSNLYTYPNFARVIPPSQSQASAMVEMMFRQGWRYMHVLKSDSNFGLYGANTIESVGMSRDICTTNKETVPADNSLSEWDKLFNKLDQRADARVLVLFLEPQDIRNLFRQLTNRRKVGQYFIVTSDRWPFMEHQALLTEFPNLVKGLTVVTTPLRMFGEFKNYFVNLRPDSNIRNPWFKEYWQNKFQCSLDGDGTPCSGTNTVSQNDLTDKHIADVIDAVYAVGHGLQTMQQILCPGQNHVCVEMTRSPGRDLWDYIRQQRFSSINQDHNQIAFNSLGDGNPVYDVYNYQSAVDGGAFEFVKIGHFANYAYAGGIDNNRLKVYDENGNEIISPESQCVGQCHDCKRVDEGNTAEIKDGDVWLGGFFRLHGIGADKLTCNDEVVFHNMQLLEAFLFAIDSINNDPRVLPNIKVGAIGFDTCGSPTRAQREAGNFITAVVEYRGGYFNNRLTVSGIIGEETSDTTLALADIVTPLKVSQISYAATTTKLDDRETYPYFMRTVASDKHQAQAIAAILDRFNWKYVSVVYSDNEYGNDMYKNIKNVTSQKGICIALAFKVLDSFAADDFSVMVKELQLNPQAKVVILLTSTIDTKALLRQAESLQVLDLQWIGGDTWGMRQEMIESAPLSSLGAIVLQFHSRTVPGFREYFTGRPTYTNLRNPWWKQYLSDLFQCNLPVLDVPAKYQMQCPWTLDFDSVYQEVPEVEYIVTAVNMFAVGLEFAMLELCPNITSYVCKEVYEHPELLNKHIRQAGFMHKDGTVFQFDELGNGPANYNILNIQRSQGDFASYSQVGKWESGILHVDPGQVKMYNGNTEINAFQTECQGRCSECIDESNKNIEFTRVPGNIQIPALFAIHESGDHRVECGAIRDAGVINLEAFLYAIDLINADNSLLPNVRVGTTAFDTCSSSARGVRELSGLLSGVMNYDKDDTKLSGSFSTIVGVVGADNGDVTRDTAMLTGQYKYAQVSYGSDSEIASSDPFLLHAGPSYVTQAEGVLALIRTYKWRYISVVQEEGNPFFQGTANFIKSSSLEDICVATYQTIQNDRRNMAAIVSELISAADNGAKVVVVFASPSEIKALIEELANRAGSADIPHLTWVLALSENIYVPDFIPGPSESAILRGALAIFPSEFDLPADFQQRLRQLDDNPINPWYKGTGPFSDAAISESGQKAAYVIDATYAIAHGIHYLLSRKCPGGDICSGFLQADPVEFYQAIAGVSFNGINSYAISFSDGSLVRNYKVANFQQSSNSLIDYVKVGAWKSGEYQPTLANSVRLFDGANEVDNVPSYCSSSMCDICAQPPTGGLPPTRPPVPPQETQAPCKSGNKPGKLIGNGVGVTSSEFGSLWFIILIIICAIGVIVTLIVIGLLVWRWDEPITRTISPFLCLVILVGIVLLYGVTPIYVIPVSKAICGLQRVYPGIAWAVCLSGVFLQVMRHWRIGRRERRISGAKVSFVNNSSQFVLFAFLFVFQVIVAVEWLILQPPSLVLRSEGDSRFDSSSVDGPSTPAPTMQPVIDCAYTNQDMVTYGIFIYLLLVLTLFVSILARRYGHVISIMELNTLLVCNFVNFVIIAIWAAVELLIEGNHHRPTTCAATAITATTTLIILFAYRVKVLFRNHDPFVDTASVASGEYFSGTLNRMPGEMRNAEHIYDQPPGVEYGVDMTPHSNGAARAEVSTISSTGSLEKPYKNNTTGF
ncbi:uncharacterized protein [Amphiura filiformis]|uniref:uncharacterized protein n=1 Tax=Amphiura filiformis TaxID=82378 RepID=UPI003B2211EC